jgi:hypothetical protein
MDTQIKISRVAGNFPQKSHNEEVNGHFFLSMRVEAGPNLRSLGETKYRSIFLWVRLRWLEGLTCLTPLRVGRKDLWPRFLRYG